ncbi:hypothetical protein FXF51_40845 [Nonomuraea sp. PA05]|uniref:ATP-binding protein n=1 Tax=Nonomuraea sp. PA05 TaxID=2604466 RepID=UPI0011D636EB|nr:hypothetical protein [Nonomuraea sp. PA05]TYB57184.1 hypothetical protein FXF51_40845 [Nonomuraea sp. PA05]
MTVTPVRRIGHLPEQSTSMVGRGHELAQVTALCERSRLVTLTGPGGVGKTRLALRAAVELAARFADGARLVELSPGAEAALPHTIAEALPLEDRSTRPMLEVLADHLARRELLLILDTCEHLIEACAQAAETLLAAAPGLRILATSRRPLGLLAERTVTVEPLPVPDATGSGPRDAMLLLADRAAAVVPGFAVTPFNRPDLVRVCRRLEGLPLAIELAAARLGELSPRELADRLETRLTLLDEAKDEGDAAGSTHAAAGSADDAAGGASAVAQGLGGAADPPRHQALRTAIGWSHELCTPEQRLLWARASVFSGTFDAGTAARVCADDRLPEDQIPALLTTLCEVSVLAWLPTGGGERYRMLDTVREYGAFWLHHLGEAGDLRRRHRDHYLALAREGEAAWIGPDQYTWYDRMTAEHDNLRAALEFSLTEPDGHTAVELAGTLWFFWYGTGAVREGHGYLERALARAPEPGPAHARALWIYAVLTAAQGDGAAGAAWAAECVTVAERYGDVRALRGALVATILSALVRGEHTAAAAIATEHLAGRLEDELTLAALIAWLVLSHAHILAGEVEQAVTVLEEMRVACERHGERWQRSYGDIVRARAELARGRPADAVTFARAGLEVKHRMRDPLGIGVAVDSFALAIAAVGHPERAAYLFGLAQQLWDTVGRSQAGVPEWVAARRDCEERVRTGLGDHAYDSAYGSGYHSDLDTAIAHALAPPDR